MQSIPTTEVQSRILHILDDVERGESVLITRNDKTAARIRPEARKDVERVKRAVESILAIRKRTEPVSQEEIFAARA